MPIPLAGLAIGAGVSLAGQYMASRSAQANVDKALEAVKPRDVFTPLGAVSFGKKGVRFTPSQELATISRTALEEAAVPTDVFAGRRFEALSSLAEPREQELLDQTRERVFQSGRLGTVGGLRELRDVREAMMRAATARAIESEDVAFRRQGDLIERGMQSILRPLTAQAAVGQGATANMMNVAGQGLTSMNQFMPRAISGLGVGLGQQIPGLLNRIFGGAGASGATASPFAGMAAGALSTQSPTAAGLFGSAGLANA